MQQRPWWCRSPVACLGCPEGPWSGSTPLTSCCSSSSLQGALGEPTTQRQDSRWPNQQVHGRQPQNQRVVGAVGRAKLTPRLPEGGRGSWLLALASRLSKFCLCSKSPASEKWNFTKFPAGEFEDMVAFPLLQPPNNDP